MQILREASPGTALLLARIEQETVNFFAETSALAGELCLLDARSRFVFATDFPQCLLRVKEGVATVALAGNAILSLIEGDIFGIPAEHEIADLTLETDFAIHVYLYKLPEIHDLLLSSAELKACWERIQHLRYALFLQLYSEHTSGAAAVFPSIRYYEPGAEIIAEGADAPEVFTMVEGVADVYHRQTPVGTIGNDEIFGALAALSGTPRTATVIARSRCTVAVLPVGDFRSLIQQRPLTTEKLILDFARKIVQLNARLVGK